MKIGTKNNKMLDFDGDNFIPNIFFQTGIQNYCSIFFIDKEEEGKRGMRETGERN